VKEWRNAKEISFKKCHWICWKDMKARNNIVNAETTSQLVVLYNLHFRFSLRFIFKLCHCHRLASFRWHLICQTWFSA
jgi:hypothetical protein